MPYERRILEIGPYDNPLHDRGFVLQPDEHYTGIERDVDVFRSAVWGELKGDYSADQIALRTVDLAELDSSEGQYDEVVALGSVAERDQISKIHSLLKPGGVLLLGASKGAAWSREMLEGIEAMGFKCEGESEHDYRLRATTMDYSSRYLVYRFRKVEKPHPPEASSIPQEKLAAIKARVLQVVGEHLERDYDFGSDGFTPVQINKTGPVNKLWIGEVTHVPVSDDPKLVATIFTQKMQSQKREDEPVKNLIGFFICEEPLKKDDLINYYDHSLSKEKISFMLEFDFAGERRHSLKHRYIAPKFRGGLGTDVLKEYEKYFQRMANKREETQSHVMLTSQRPTLNWARKNGYVPETPRDVELVEKLDSGDRTVIVDGGGMYEAFGEGSSLVPIYIMLRRDFNPV